MLGFSLISIIYRTLIVQWDCDLNSRFLSNLLSIPDDCYFISALIKANIRKQKVKQDEQEVNI